MKTILFLLLILLSSRVNSQDVFQQKLFAADQILKYKNELSLQTEKEVAIKKIYNEHITAFNTIKWDLDAELTKMSKLLSSSSIDIEEAKTLMDLVLKKEEQLKKLRFEMMVEIKNLLTELQQQKLQELKKLHKEYNSGFVASLTENPRISFKVEGKQKPLYIIKDKQGKLLAENIDFSIIEPSRIKSVTVLKDEAAVDIYGDKGRNGVVIIEVKKDFKLE